MIIFCYFLRICFLFPHFKTEQLSKNAYIPYSEQRSFFINCLLMSAGISLLLEEISSIKVKYECLPLVEKFNTDGKETRGEKSIQFATGDGRNKTKKEQF